MENPSGYLYRVGLNWGRKSSRRHDLGFPEAAQSDVDWFEPGLPGALAGLSDQQRVVVFLVHGHQWSLSEVAAQLEISKGTVQTHMERGMERLRRELKVES
jgi:RNA polymerase sigma-70 factor (ECF subfamily)